MSVQRRVIPILQKAPDTAVPAAVYGDTIDFISQGRPINGESQSIVRAPTGPESAGWNWEQQLLSTLDNGTEDHWIMQAFNQTQQRTTFGIRSRTQQTPQRELMPDLGTPDHWVECGVTGGGWDADELHICLRAGPVVPDLLPDNLNCIGLSTTAWGMPTSAHVLGYKAGLGGGFVTITSGISIGQWERFRLEAEGTTLRIFVNNVQSGGDIDLTPFGTWTGTRCGLFSPTGAYNGANSVYGSPIRCGTLPYTPPP